MLVNEWTVCRIEKPPGKRYWTLLEPEPDQMDFYDAVLDRLPDHPEVGSTSEDLV
jgi:hypothetical protein